MADDPREPLGRLVHETRLAHNAELSAAAGRQRFFLAAWEWRTDEQRELDMRIGEAVAAAEFDRIKRLAKDTQAIGRGPGGTTEYFTRIMTGET